MVAVPFRSAKELAALIRRKKIGALELLDLYVRRMETYNSRINAIIATDLDGTRKRARAADRALARGEVWGPLHGVPMTIKESYDVVGMPTTWGVPALKGNYPKKNALVVDRMLAGDRVRAEVHDTGPGVPVAERNRLFREHTKLSPRPTGGEESNGLGLSIVKHLIESQSGTVGADFPGQSGSIFWFELPAR